MNTNQFVLTTLGAMTVSTLLAPVASAGTTGFAASTDRVAYTGDVTRYPTLVDAQNGTNSLGTHIIPDRDTDAPFNTASRDVAFYFVDNHAGFDIDRNILLTAWYYTTSENTNSLPKDDPGGDRLYSGWGNPNNTNTGFLQMYDDNGSTDTGISGAFSNFNGTHYQDFTLQASGSNATAEDDFGRLWPAPQVGGPGSDSPGNFVEYSLNVTFGGLEGTDMGGGLIEAIDHPDSVTGSFTAIFQNRASEFGGNASLDGFYVVDFTFNMDSWAFGVGDAALNGDLSDSYFATVPAPGALALLGFAGFATRRRRRG